MKLTFSRLPIFVQLTTVSGFAMFVPAVHAIINVDHSTSRSFLYSGILTLILSAFVGIATHDRPVRNLVRNQLLSILGAFTILPLVLAVPLYDSIGNTSFVNAYVEMVSSATTTGALIFDAPGRLNGSEHLWRAIVAWMGGLLMWSTAAAIFAPLNLGGYEVAMRSSAVAGGRVQLDQTSPVGQRLLSSLQRLGPVYTVLTGVLWIALVVVGDAPLAAVIRAMSTLSTSGILLPNSAPSGRIGEVIVLVFFLFALSRATFGMGVLSNERRDLRSDPELRLAAAILVLLPLLLFARHFFGAITVDESGDSQQALHAAWGSLFTVASFLTTTGFISDDWTAARFWSGLEAPGLLLMGVALIGGGVATTAGGIKLLRVYALLKHGQREIDRLVHPSSIGGSGGVSRSVRRDGAFIAWVFFMLLAISLAIIMGLLALFEVDFESALILTISALCNVGPLSVHASLNPVSFGDLPSTAKLILAIAMVIGRLEVLAMIALLNPEFWRS